MEKDKKKDKQQNKRCMKQKVILFITGLVIIGIVTAVLLWKVSDMGQEASKEVVFKIGDEKVYLDEVNLCILQNTVNLGITEDLLDTTMEDGSSADDYYKNQILQVIMDYKVEAKIAKQRGISLTEEELQSIRSDAIEYMGKIDGRILKKLGITRERIIEIYTERCLAHALEETVTQDITVEEQNYCTMYMLMFPKVKMDENGDYVRAEDGETPVMLSDYEMEQKKKDADAAYEELLSGADIEEIADKYNVTGVSGEESDLADSFGEPFSDYAKTLKEGEYSPVLEVSSCYVILKMITVNDKDVADQILEYYKADLKEDAVDENKSEWYEEAGIKEEPDFVGNTWKTISFYDFVQYVEE